MVSDKSFAAKLGAFMLNGLDKAYVIKCFKQGGFDKSSDEVLGLLPFLHMNITKGQFSHILRSSNGNLQKATRTACNAKKLNNVLKKVHFNCNDQSDKAVSVLVERIIDTIETGYNSRISGKKHVSELAANMRWQEKNNIIPSSSIEWCEGVKSASNVEPR